MKNLNKVKFTLLVFPLLCSFSTVAQIDSANIEVDTVYIKKPPVIIRLNYYLPEDNSPSWIVSGAAGLSHGIAYTNSTDLWIKNNSFLYPTLLLGREWKRWSCHAGLSYFNFKGHSLHSQKQSYEYLETYTVKDTIETYYQNVNGNITTYYVTEDRQETGMVKSEYDSIGRTDFTLSYLLILFQAKYIFHYHSWLVSPSVSFAPCFSIASSQLVDNMNDTRPNSVFLMSSLGLGIGRKISDKLSLEVYADAATNITPLTKDKVIRNLFFISGGFKVNYFFKQWNVF